MRPTQTREEKRIDKAIETEWYRQASGIQVNILDIPKIFADARRVITEGVSVEDAIRAAITRYQVRGVTA